MSDRTSDLTVQHPDRAVGPLAREAQEARRYAAQARSDSTRRAYRADWSDFTRWCDERAVSALPATADTVTLYIVSRAGSAADGGPGLKVSTLTRRLAAISQAHKLAGHPSPTSRQNEPLHSVWRGLVREKGVAPAKVAPTLTPDIAAMVGAIATGVDDAGDASAAADALRGKRDRALLLIGFAGALRRSELAAVRVADVTVGADGLRLVIPKSKTDQERAGQVIGLAYGAHAATCPVRAYRSWVHAASNALGCPLTGPVFRGVGRWGTLAGDAIAPRTVARVVKARAAAAGLDPALYSGHSLRAGFATQAARSGKADRSIMKQTRHKSVQTLNEYVRDGRLFDDNPSDGLGL
ncbi:MAG: tyrosine-type recombinase/integrase [Rhodothermales bacterium]